MAAQSKHIALSSIYFLLSALLTGLFIASKSWLYPSVGIMILVGSIAGVKWGIQVVAALTFLGKNKWLFIRHIGFACLIGSCLLFSYNLMSFLPFSRFIQSIAAIYLSLIVTIILYYRAVRNTGIGIQWFWGWLACLIIAIMLQIVVLK
ncbi:hypothetical protein FW774_04515 (plasmid) [Pedobacter sp. BS3]|uniref:hypothetical protein n=1 Tax=Pedobacter sp. BS3 TaxID=2567937 RepID=UPI0011EF03C5|nr:hypothetical protein [Pedobacter sp. BS3]TZF86316.1 hypothetical protein FW774_04515 [Pedobacter sp. BS3]